MKRTTKAKKLTHAELKGVGKELLRHGGFTDNLIEEEWEINVANKKKYILDIAGLNTEGKVLVGIECGKLDASKLIVLEQLIPKVVHIPYFFRPVENLDLELFALREKNKQLTRELERNKAKIKVEETERLMQTKKVSKDPPNSVDFMEQISNQLDDIESKPQRRMKAISILERLKTEITNLPPPLLLLYRLLTETDAEEKRAKKKIEQRLV